jgi:hypothetical protein
MSIRITLIDGTVVEKDDYDYDMVVPRLLKAGCKLWKLNERMLVQVDKVAFVEDTTDYESMEEQEIADILAEAKEIESTMASEEERDNPAPEEKKQSIAEREQEALALMKELSECKHEEHEIYYQDSSTGRGRKPIRRYFPVCAKCGLREKYVKSDSLPDEVKEAAKPYDK